jgi:hypothetical protein
MENNAPVGRGCGGGSGRLNEYTGKKNEGVICIALLILYTFF